MRLVGAEFIVAKSHSVAGRKPWSVTLPLFTAAAHRLLSLQITKRNQPATPPLPELSPALTVFPQATHHPSGQTAGGGWLLSST